MIRIEKITPIHRIDFRSSGRSKPRKLCVENNLVHYGSTFKKPPTFLATADLQGREIGRQNRLLGEVVSEEISILQNEKVVPELDFGLLCGDFYDYPDLRKLGGTGDVTHAVNALSDVSNQSFLVLGNHDQITLDDLSPKIKIMDGNTAKVAGLTIGGVSGIIGNPKRNNRETEELFLEKVLGAAGSKTDILMLHQGPKGENEEQKGCEAVNDLLKMRSNLMVVFGHCHWNTPFVTVNQNLYCNVDLRILVFTPSARR